MGPKIWLAGKIAVVPIAVVCIAAIAPIISALRAPNFAPPSGSGKSITLLDFLHGFVPKEH